MQRSHVIFYLRAVVNHKQRECAHVKFSNGQSLLLSFTLFGNASRKIVKISCPAQQNRPATAAALKLQRFFDLTRKTSKFQSTIELKLDLDVCSILSQVISIDEKQHS